MGKYKRKRRSSNSARKGAMMVLALVAVVLFSWRRTVSTHAAEAKLLGVETGFVAERKARDAAAGLKGLVRRLTSLNETGGKINLGTPCLQKLGNMHTCHPLSVLWKVGNTFVVLYMIQEATRKLLPENGGNLTPLTLVPLISHLYLATGSVAAGRNQTRFCGAITY
jgi:hypothetical protein